LEISSCHPYSPVFEQGGPFEKVPVVGLSSSLDEEGLIPDVEEEVHEEDVADTEAASSSVVKSLTITASANDADKGRSPDREIGGSGSDGDKAGSP
jgi:hypothetical protein